MDDGTFASIDRVRRVRVPLPALAATIEVFSVEDYKGRGWGTPQARIEGPAPGEFTVTANCVEALYEGLVKAFAAFEREFGPGSR